jgi:D-arabinitol 4-dehydrogenase
VHAHEEAKIRVLNGTHSCIAWAGTLRGLGYIHEGVALPEIRRIAFDYVTDDVIPCLDAPGHPSPLDLPLYRDVVLERFGNPWLRDTNQRVAMDGYSKIPGFIVPTLRQRIAQQASIASTAMLPALFFAVLERWHRGGLAYAYQDGVMDPAAAHALFTTADPLAAFCRDRVLWGALAGNETLTAAIRAADARVRSFMKG